MDRTSSVTLGPGQLESLWLQHKDEIHHLYITENKTLNQVKHAMEHESAFPKLR